MKGLCCQNTELPNKVKSKAIPVTGHRGLQGCEMLRFPHCLDKWLTGGS
jgi:hypothetical protein